MNTRNYYDQGNQPRLRIVQAEQLQTKTAPHVHVKQISAHSGPVWLRV